MGKGNKDKGNGKDEALMPDMKKFKKSSTSKKDITEEIEVEEPNSVRSERAEVQHFRCQVRVLRE